MKSAIKWIYLGLLGYLSLEIVVRRWCWSQVPTQFSSVWVYAILAINGYVLYRLVNQSVIEGRWKKKDKD